MNHKVIRETMYVTELPIDQSIGDYSDDDTPCCIGARLAGHLCENSSDYVDGIDAFAKQIGCNRAHLILLFSQAGAGNAPLGPRKWNNQPKHVWENLLKIEKLPELMSSDLRGASLFGTNLSGVDLTSANLSGADLTSANLSGANLSGANLTGAYLSETDLSGANLSGANLTLADLTGADLTGTDLTGVDLTGTNLSDTELEQE